LSYHIQPYIQSYASRLEDQEAKKARSTGKIPIVEIIQARTKDNMDSRTIIEGEGGIGKSYTALRLAELLDARFTEDPPGAVEQQVQFSASEYMEAVNSLSPGSVLIYDEPGQSFHHREFMSEANIILSKVMIGYRFKLFISFLCIPGLGLIDKDGKMLVKFLINVVHHGQCEVFKQLPQKFGGDPWWVTITDKQFLGLPGVKLRHAYEAKKKKVENALYSSYHKVLKARETPRLSNNDIVEIILKDPKRYKTEQDSYGIAPLMSEFDIGRERARAIRHKLSQKALEPPS
jgi:hypothetical protein